MQVYTRKYLEHFKNLRILKIKFDTNPTSKNEKALLDLRKLMWPDTKKYTRSYRKYRKENRNYIDAQLKGYKKIEVFFSQRLILNQ
jgi:hypothetical protein